MATENPMEPHTDLNVSGVIETGRAVKYDVILSDSVKETPPRAPSPNCGSTKPVVSIERIEHKLEAAATRRKSLEGEKLAKIAEKFDKIEKAALKRIEVNTNFMNSTKEALELKMNANSENREKIVSDLKQKLVSHNVDKLEEVRSKSEQLVSSFEEKAKEEMMKKLELAAENRQKTLQEKIESLKKLDEKVEHVRLAKRNSGINLENGNGQHANVNEAGDAS